MPNDLTQLLELARKTRMTPAQLEAQRRSFAYGNTKIENPRLTRDSINRAAEKLATTDGTEDRPQR